MEHDRTFHVLASIAAITQGSLAERLCSAAERQLASSGVALSLRVNDHLLESVALTAGARVGEALQTEFGEGPSYTSAHTGEPVLLPDVRRDGTWPAFSRAAAGTGLCGVFAFPLRRGTSRIGALTIYRDIEAAFTDDHHADALVYARVGHDLIVALQAQRPVDELDQLIVDGTADTVEIHQAAGAVSVQLGVDVETALAVLRARAFADDQSLRELAADVVARRVRLDD